MIEIGVAFEFPCGLVFVRRCPTIGSAMKTRDKLNALRALLKKRGLAAYLVPSTDPHQSEYVPACWQRRS